MNERHYASYSVLFHQFHCDIQNFAICFIQSSKQPFVPAVARLHICTSLCYYVCHCSLFAYPACDILQTSGCSVGTHWVSLLHLNSSEQSALFKGIHRRLSQGACSANVNSTRLSKRRGMEPLQQGSVHEALLQNRWLTATVGFYSMQIKKESLVKIYKYI